MCIDSHRPQGYSVPINGKYLVPSANPTGLLHPTLVQRFNLLRPDFCPSLHPHIHFVSIQTIGGHFSA
jgi:hypothetical protein